MSCTVTVQVGQAGNQVGSSIHDALHTTSPNPQFFRTSSRGQSVARSVMIDTEPKVVQGLKGGEGWRYSHDNKVVLAQGGAANNWARGYAQEVTDGIEAVRREVERCYCLGGVMMVHSAAGGTGSGLGCRVAEEIKDSLGHKAVIMSSVVHPFHAGEVIVQDYNATLTLARLQQCVDSIVHLENEDAARACRKCLKIDNPSLAHINAVMSDQVAGVFLDSRLERESVCPLDVGDFVTHMSPSPAFKITSLYCCPLMPDSSKSFNRDTWGSGIVGRMRQMYRCGGGYECDLRWGVREDAYRGVAGMLVLRGDGGKTGGDGDDVWKVDIEKEWGGGMWPGWNPKPFLCSRSETNVSGLEKAGFLAVNSQACLPMLERISGCRSKFEVGAYVHQYEGYGVGRDEFKEAFYCVDQIKVDYKSI